MRRIPTMMSSAGAAALTTLAVAVAVPAIGDDGASAPSPDALAACLRAHGLDGAPDGDGLKPWLGQRLEGDATAKRALKACPPKPVPAADKRVEEQRLRSCLKDHGIEVSGDDPAALKRWIVEHHDEAATASALKACGLGLVDKSAVVRCAKDGPVGGAVPGKPADKPDAGDAPATNRAVAAGT